MYSACHPASASDWSGTSRAVSRSSSSAVLTRYASIGLPTLTLASPSTSFCNRRAVATRSPMPLGLKRMAASTKVARALAISSDPAALGEPWANPLALVLTASNNLAVARSCGRPWFSPRSVPGAGNCCTSAASRPMSLISIGIRLIESSPSWMTSRSARLCESSSWPTSPDKAVRNWEHESMGMTNVS